MNEGIVSSSSTTKKSCWGQACAGGSLYGGPEWSLPETLKVTLKVKPGLCCRLHDTGEARAVTPSVTPVPGNRALSLLASAGTLYMHV